LKLYPAFDAGPVPPSTAPNGDAPFGSGTATHREEVTMSAALPSVPTPSAVQVRTYLGRWRDSINGRIDAALTTAFVAMPRNDDVGEVAVKIAALNGLYATNIFGIVQVARHVVALDIDVDLAENTADPELIERIANVSIGGKRRRNYSFATKYCSFHRPEVYPIFDSLVADVLNTLLK
jgi:hypothetical protein